MSRDASSPRQLAWPRLIPGLPRGRRALSGAPRPDTLVRTTQPAELHLQPASLMCRPDSSPTRASANRSLHRTTRPTTGRAKRRVNHEKRKQREHGPPGDRGEPRVRSAFYSAGLRPSLHPVYGSTSLRGVSRSLSKRGVPRLRPRHTAHPPLGSELPRRFSCQPWRRRGCENPRTLGVGFLGLYPAFSDPFLTRKGS